MTAASCLSAVKSIFSGELKKEDYEKAITILIPIWNFVLSSDGCDYLDEGADILNIILYNLDTIDARLWFYFPTMFYLLLSVNEKQLENK